MSETVVHIITGLGAGGAERMLSRLVTFDFEEPKPRQVVVSLGDEGVFGSMLRDAGVELHCLNLKLLTAPVALWRLCRLLISIRPDSVVTWLYHADLMGTIACWLTGVENLYWNIRCSNIEFSNYSPFTRWTVQLLSRLSGYPAGVLYNSKVGKAVHAEIGYHPKRWCYVPNGFDLDEWYPDEGDRDAVRSEWGVTDENFVIGMVARVDPQKDYPTFLAAVEAIVRKYGHVRIVLIGKGTEQVVQTEGVKHVTFCLGQRRDVTYLMRGLDLIVLSSAYGEGFPNVLGEAMATGVPCVTTNVGDAAEVVGDTGRVAPVSNPGKLAGEIEQMIVMGHGDRQDLRSRARRRIRDFYSMPGKAVSYRQIWSGLVRSDD
ncbi:glycosyltransferase [Aestuariispira ectoiniformans]|uniref:glycosyltransferase n=1 Tax=Aestuariispira ectoiniformans TaxID=2775080 RepID=UPI00223B6C2A|nr:glycosyltransferase [Aestuariispira ectoiniformans]